MRPGARTPEELDVLLEDAFVVRDRRAVAALFESEGLLVDGVAREARGAREIARVAEAMWHADRTYVAEPRRVLQAHDTALVVSEGSINVVRRGSDGAWRYAISLLSLEHDEKEEQ